MKNKYILLLLSMALSTMIYATDPWGEPEILYNSMTVMAQVSIDGTPAADGDVLAAFVRTGRELHLRGKADVMVVDGIAGCLLQIFTESNGERVFFMVWDESSNLLCDPMQHLYSEINSIVGSYPDNLYQINATGPGISDDPWPAPIILPGSMTVMTQVSINDIPAEPYDVLAAFVTVDTEEQLRGKAVVRVIDGLAGCLLQVFTVNADEDIHFKVWDYSAQQIFACSNLLVSEPDGEIGQYPDNMYFINPNGAIQQIGQLDFNPPAGIYGLSPQISISCGTAGATIRYTTDGSKPTASSPQYAAPFTLPEAATTTVKAKAFGAGSYPSLIQSATYRVNGRVATPTFSLAPGTYTFAQELSIACATPMAQIRYTTDGSDPAEASSLYSTPISLPLNTYTVIKARAYLADWGPSHIAEAAYTIGKNVATPTFSPEPGAYKEEISVEIFCETPLAQIYYTLDGTIPTQSSTLYSAPIAIADSTLVSARAFYQTWTPSDIATALYIIPVSNPTGYQLPELCGIKAAYPNPFQDRLNIALQAKDSYQEYKLRIYNVKGACVHTRQGIAKGSFELAWDGRDAQGSKLPSGIYLLCFSTKDLQATRRVILY